MFLEVGSTGSEENTFSPVLSLIFRDKGKNKEMKEMGELGERETNPLLLT